MTAYDYTDGGGRTLHVHPFLPGPSMEIAAPNGTVHVGAEEAPALALAILEAAGIDNSASRHLAAAWRNLNRHVSERRWHAKREAEDAEVRAFMQALGVDTDRGFVLDPEDRVKYRAAKEFFTRDRALAALPETDGEA